MPKPKLSIIGLGRIGGSIGLALKKANAELEIVGHDKDSRVAQQALKRGAVDKTEWNLLNACDGAGLIVLALPLRAIQDTLKILSNELPTGVIVSDTASSKVTVLEWAEMLPDGVTFIGGHPVISPRKAADNAALKPDAKGIEAADADLFQNAVYCLTPTVSADPDAVQVMTGFVSMLGAKPLFLDAAEHDGLVSGAQHLSYLLSAALLHTTTASGGWRELSKFAGSDYLHATELAMRDPASQRMVMLSQRENLARWIDLSIETLKELRGLIARGEEAPLDAWFERIIAAREQWMAGQVGAESAVDLAELRGGPMRLLLGGLAERGGKKK
jgi:prephenate dehydrogenase